LENVFSVILVHAFSVIYSLEFRTGRPLSRQCEIR